MNDFNEMFNRSLETMSNHFSGEDKAKLAIEIKKRTRREKRYQNWDGYKHRVQMRLARMQQSQILRQGMESYSKDPYNHTLKVASMLSLAFNLMCEGRNK